MARRMSLCRPMCVATTFRARSTAARRACRATLVRAATRATGTIRCRRSAHCWSRWTSGSCRGANRHRRVCQASLMALWCAPMPWRGRNWQRWCRRTRRTMWWSWATGPIHSHRRACGRLWCRRSMPMATRSLASGCRTSLCRAGRSPDGICTANRGRRGSWPIVTARISRSLRHEPNVSRAATRGPPSPNVMRRRTHMLPACGKR